jgi:hypothetical protein
VGEHDGMPYVALEYPRAKPEGAHRERRAGLQETLRIGAK